MRRQMFAILLAGVGIIGSGGAADVFAADGSADSGEGVTIRGRVELTTTVPLDGTTETSEVAVVADDGTSYPIAPSDAADELHDLAGTDVVVTGTLTGDELLVGTVAALGAPEAALAVGARTAVVILYRFADGGPAAMTPPGKAEQLTFGTGPESLASMLKKESNGQLTLTGDVVSETLPAGWPYAWSDCTTTARAALTSHLAAKYPGYHHYMFNGPAYGCNNAAGVASVGGSGSWYYTTFYPQLLWHEIGHNLGLGHAAALWCEQPGNTEWKAHPVYVAPGCTTGTYGDWHGAMGAGWACGYSTWNKAVVGWNVDRTTVAADATVQVRASDLAPNGAPQAIVVPGAPTQWGGLYYLEWQTSDYPKCKSRKDTGLQIRIVGDPASGSGQVSRLVDGRKESGTAHEDFLPVGRTMRDSITGTSITLDAVDTASGVATVTIKLNTPPLPPPPPPPATTVDVTAGALRVTGGEWHDTLDVHDDAGGVLVTNTNDVVAGAGCISVTTKQARCSGATSIALNAGDGNDNVTFHSALPATVDGGKGYWNNDRFYAGPTRDGPTRILEFNYAHYSARSAPLFLANDGLANDGESGEGDDTDTTAALYGGTGNDHLIGSNNTVYGGPGDDRLEATKKGGGLFGEAGNDTIVGNTGKDGLVGGDGDDYLDGGKNIDSYQGEGGNDTIVAKDGKSEYVDCGDGNDTATADPKPAATYKYGDQPLWQCENVTF